MLIISLDPGKVTGLAFYTVETEHMEGSEIGFDDFGDWLNVSLTNLKAQGTDVLVVIERFTIFASTAKKSQDAHWSLELIGVTRYLCHCHDVSLLMQLPGDAKHYANDEKLRRAGWYVKGKGHANDAIRHVALAMNSLRIPPPWVK